MRRLARLRALSLASGACAVLLAPRVTSSAAGAFPGALFPRQPLSPFQFFNKGGEVGDHSPKLVVIVEGAVLQFKPLQPLY